MPIACNLIRDQPHYRREAFDTGLRACGYDVTRVPSPQPGPDHLLLIWNRYGENEALAARYEAAGALVLVAENGYTHRRDEQRRQYYSLARGQVHHGGVPYRYAPLDAALDQLGVQPWREAGGHILVCDQRGIGSPLMASPPDWGLRIQEELRAATRREVRLRPHPGNRPDRDAVLAELTADLRGAWCVVTWASNAGIHALIAGIPVFFDAPTWIAWPDARPLRDAGRLNDIEQPFISSMRFGLRRALANEWSVEQIAAGKPFLAHLDALVDAKALV